MRVRHLVLLRHGQTEFNAGSRMQGQLDTDLSDLGRGRRWPLPRSWPSGSRWPSSPPT